MAYGFGTPMGFAAPVQRPIINIGQPTGGAAGLSPQGGNATYSPRDYIIAALANVGQRAGAGAGLIPALLGGIGETYVANKQAQALNQKAIQDDLIRRNSQASLAQMMGNIPPEYIQAAAAANPELFKMFMEQSPNLANSAYTNKQLQQLGQPNMEGAPNREYQNALLNTLYGYQEKLPGMQQTNLENQYLQGTLPGRVGATNARSQADIQYAVPTAGANLKGKQLTNQEKAIMNQYLPAQQQAILQGRQLGNVHQRQVNAAYPQMTQLTKQSKMMAIAKQQAIAKEMSNMDALNQVLHQIDKEHPDPQVFRGLSMEVLKNAPVSAQGRHAAMQQIDDMTIMKMQGANAHQIMQQKGNPQQPRKGLFGLNY